MKESQKQRIQGTATQETTSKKNKKKITKSKDWDGHIIPNFSNASKQISFPLCGKLV